MQGMYSLIKVDVITQLESIDSVMQIFEYFRVAGESTRPV